jgi:DNA-binding sugar fermentation-stimulating protein
MEVYRYGSLVKGNLVRRINRFVSEARLEGQNETTLCYMANPGSMLGMCVAGSEIRVSIAPPGPSTFRYRIEGIKIRGTWIGCNTMLANKLVASLLSNGLLVERGLLRGFDSFRSEVKEGATRFDFVTQSGHANLKTFIEVKTVTMASNWYDIETSEPRADKPFHNFPESRPIECHPHKDSMVALFPDCESKRAQKHVEHLSCCAKRTNTNSVMIFVVVRDDVTTVSPSDHCDGTYSSLLRKSEEFGMKCIGLQFRMCLEDASNSIVEFVKSLPVNFATIPGNLGDNVGTDFCRAKRTRRS